ncbi:hypothetical protein TNCV_5048431 [Trichonephila clavipes]|nr:hypothetical protein TNCV_5048431 [Trichonephila clavipes]
MKCLRKALFCWTGVSLEEFIAANEDNVCTVPIMAHMVFFQNSENIIDADSDDEKETNKAYPVPTSSKKRNIMKSMRHGPTAPGPRATTTMETSPRFRIGLNKIMIRIISTDKCFFPLYSPKNWEYWTICQLVTCDDRHPCIDLSLPPYTIITHSVKRRQLVEPVCAIVSHAHLFVLG